jgi:WD40 repeat protein
VENHGALAVSNFRTLRIALAFAMLCSCAALVRAEDDPAPVSFTKDVAPIFVKRCSACHGPPEVNGGYQVVTFSLLVKPGESELPSIMAGKPEESEVFNLISSADADVRMPKEADPLSAEQIALVKRWISEGAKYDGADPNATLASIVPSTAQPDPPETYRRPVPITALAFNADGSELAAGGYHEVTIWNATDGKLVRRIKNVAERVYSVAYSPDGALVAVAGGVPGQLGEVKLFNSADGKLVKELPTSADVVYRAVFNPAGTKLATGGADRAIRIFDVASGKQEILIEDHADWVVGLSWSPDGAKQAAARRDNN